MTVTCFVKSAAVVLAVAAAVVTAVPANANTSTASWQNFPIPAQTGNFTAVFDAVPNTSYMDGVTALSAGAASGYSNCALLVRFNSQGYIDVRNGNGYMADAAVAYAPGVSYRFRVVADMAAKTYSVFVTPQGGVEQALATDYGFRSEQATASRVANYAIIAEPGTHTVSNFQVVPPPVVGVTSAITWKNSPFTAQTGAFTAEFDAVPNAAGMDGVTALSTSAAGGYGNCAVLVRFNSANAIDVRNGNAYTADSTMIYTPGTSYHFRIAVSVPAKTYSVYVTPKGGVEQTLAANYAFRTEQAGATSLANWALIAEPGTHTVSNFKVAASAANLTVDAGNDQAVQLPSTATLNASAALNGSTTLPYGVSFAWSRVSGPGTVTFGNAYTLDTTATFSLGGTYVLRLSGTYNGQTVSDTVTVHAVPRLTIAAAPATGTAPLAVQFTAMDGSTAATASRLPTGSTLSWACGQTPGSTGTGTTFSATYSAAGTFTPALRMTLPSGMGTVDCATTTIQVADNNTKTSTTTWQNTPFTAQTGTFQVEFDARPNAGNMDGVTGLSAAAVSSYSGCAVAVRFNGQGMIDVRNGGGYGADSAVTYAAGTSYHFRAIVNVPARTYSVYVTPAGSTERQLATNYAFRTEQASVTTLANWAFIADPGTHTVSGFRISAAPLVANAGADKTMAPGSSTILDGSASGGTAPYTYTWTPTTGLSSATVARPTASPSATTTYTLTVKDAANRTATDSVQVTVQSAPLSANAGADKSITAGQSTTLTGSANGGNPPYTYSWTPTTGLGSPTSASTTAAPGSSQTYTLTVKDAVGATATDSITVSVTPVATSTYYVATNGSDSNPGTSTAPWRTLSKAANTAQAGAQVIVRSGTYNETLRPAYSGQSGKLIVFKSETPRGAIIDGQNSRGSGIDLSGRTYIRVDGFEVRYHTTYGILVQLASGTTSNGIEIANCYIHHTGNYTGWNGGGTAIQASNLRNGLIEGNEIYYNGDSAIGLNGSGFQAANVTIRNNNIHYNGRDGITGSGTNIVIEYNRMYDSVHTALHQDCIELWMCNGIIVRYNIMGDYTQLVYGGMVSGMTQDFVNLQVYGNVMYNSIYWSRYGQSCPGVFIDCRNANQGNDFRALQVHSNTFLFLGRCPVLFYGASGMTMDDIRIYNNIFYQCGGTGGTAAYSIDNRFTNVRADYNCFTNVSPNLSGQDRNSITTSDPGFVNYTVGAATFDARLKSTSPCINRGLSTLPSAVTLPTPFVDMTGKTRPSGGNYDIGAYEY